MEKNGLEPAAARTRAQILYWAFLGFALSQPELPSAQLQELLDGLLQMVSR